MTCGWLTLPLKVVLDGEAGELRMPVPCYLIDHPKGQVLFDSGMHADLQAPPEHQDDLTALLVKRFKTEFKAGEELVSWSIHTCISIMWAAITRSRMPNWWCRNGNGGPATTPT